MIAKVALSPPLPLTPQQHRFMLVLQRRQDAFPDQGVSYEELRVAIGAASKSNVARLVDECMRRGWLAKSPHTRRSLRILRRVGDAEAVAPLSLISALSDTEILMEASRRGLLRS